MKDMPMKSPFLAAAVLLLTASAATAQTGAIVISAQQVEQIGQDARAAQAASTPVRPSLVRPIIAAPPYEFSLDRRIGKSPASLHPGEAEVIIVLDGAGTITTGGTLVNATTAANGNISGTDIAGGTPQHAVKGDMLIVPQGTAHMMVPDAGGALVLAALHLPRAGEPAPVPGRTPAAPKLINLAADIPAMTEKAKAAAATSPRFFGGETILSLAPYRMGLEYRTAKGIASVHKNDGEFMLVLEGEGVIVAGGTVTNPKDLGANIDGDAIAGGVDHHMKKGDWIFVPKGLPHLARTDGTFVLATLHVP
jgi:mannose-6-phosphate isomerase-like protein (cupin superfamily)